MEWQFDSRQARLSPTLEPDTRTRCPLDDDGCRCYREALQGTQVLAAGGVDLQREDVLSSRFSSLTMPAVFDLAADADRFLRLGERGLVVDSRGGRS